jgi:hypothetical protein
MPGGLLSKVNSIARSLVKAGARKQVNTSEVLVFFLAAAAAS